MTSPAAPPRIARSQGMRDLLPAEMRAFRRVEDAFRAASNRWGYEEIRTPTIETYSLFTAAGALTPQMLSRVYTFLDWDGWSGERVVLRPDSTIPVVRAATEAGLELPVRLSYVQNVFRFSTTDDREDWQCGLEYLGAPDALGDLEVAAVACETLEALGLPPRVRLSHTGVVRALVEAALATGAAQEVVETAAAGGPGALRPFFAATPRLGALVDVALQAGAGPALLANLAALAREALPAALAPLDELAGIARALIDAGQDTVIDLGMDYDFAYYSGIVFEFSSGDVVWGRGGRYAPALAVDGQGATADPHSACGLGLEAGRLAAHLAAAGGRTPRPPVAVVPAAPADFGRALKVARALHRSGVAAALAQPAGAGTATVAVAVGAGTMDVTAGGQTKTITSLDDLVAFLVEYK